MSSTGIEWTDATWNPVTGCDKISPGCKHCYAEGVANRFWAKQYPPVPTIASGEPDGRDRRFTDVMTHEDRLDQPLRWKTPKKVFVNSMSDLFHEDVPDEFIDKVFAVMALAPKHTFQILTKRADRMRAYFERGPMGAMMAEDVLLQKIAGAGTMGHGWPLPNIWLGVSVENQEYADKRIPLLLQTPAAKRFVSYEPALGPVDFDSTHESDPCESSFLGGIAGERIYDGQACAVDWVIVGGESGPGARAFDIAWARSVVQQCKAAGVACFVKQLGSNAQEYLTPQQSLSDEPTGKLWKLVLASSKGGDMEEWPTDLRVREFPT